MAESPFSITVQALGTLMVAALLWQLTHIIPGRFLRYWSLAWLCLTAALFALRITASHYVGPRLRPFGFSSYLIGEYLFGFFLWAGLRDYANDRAIRRRDWLPFALLLPLSLAAPWVLPETLLIPTHTVLLAAFFAASFWTSLQIHPRYPRPMVGLNIVRAMLAGLALIFFFYGPLAVWSRFIEPLDLQYLQLSPIYDALIEIGLAFGMVVLASERGQETLESKNRQLEEASRRDALTGLYNRRHFEDLLRENRGQRTPGSLAVIDVNDLKVINDTHLHAAGDAALKIVARALVSRFRVTDPIFRVGGDEFAVVMPTGTEADLASRMADIDDALMNLRVPGIGEPMDLHVAWGVASYAHGDALPSAFDAADKAMYACKLRRKNRPDSAVR